MSLGILGKKLGMTNTYNEKGEFLAITLIDTSSCFVSQIKTLEKDKYSAVQLVVGSKREKVTTKPLIGHLKKAGLKPGRFIKELRVEPALIKDWKPGQEIKASAIFKVGDVIDVIGTSKGKGFQGVVRKYHFHGSDAGHGTHEHFRHPGSIGYRFPQHVNKGRKMPGHMGDTRITMKNLKVHEIMDDKNLLVIIGSIPGANNSYVLIQKCN